MPCRGLVERRLDRLGEYLAETADPAAPTAASDQA